MRAALLRYGFSAICVFTFFTGFAQDLHFSQFQNSPLNHNPALTGIFSGDKRFNANFRQQWFDVPVEYLTFSASYDMKFRPDFANSFWSAGAIFNYDRAGDSRLAMAYVGLNGSYTYGFSEHVLLTAGVQVGGGQRSFRTVDLLWGNYWDGEVLDPTRPSGEPPFDENRFYFDLGGGLNLRLQKSARTRLDIGAGVFHLNKPNTTFYDDESVELPIRTAIQASGSLELLPFLDLQANALVHLMGPYEEIVVGGLVNFHISQRRAREVQLAVGAGYRFGDALIPMFALRYDGWTAGISYDINTSLFDTATNGRGGPEFSLQYIITDVRPFDQSKLCRIF